MLEEVQECVRMLAGKLSPKNGGPSVGPVRIAAEYRKRWDHSVAGHLVFQQGTSSHRRRIGWC